MKCEDIRPFMLDFLYEEISDEDRKIVEAHLSHCDACRQEMDMLKSTSHILQKWEDIEPDFNVTLNPRTSTWFENFRKGWASFWPSPKKLAYGFAFGFATVFLLMAIANTKISYKSGEFSISMSLFSQPQQQPAQAAVPSKEWVEEFQKQNYYLVNSLIQQSEARQKTEWNTTLAQFNQNLEQRRYNDLQILGAGLDNIEKTTSQKIRSTEHSLNEWIRQINAQNRK
ncbi:MAG: anti-sigma factor family protein [Candidatus Zhuqueibacterota bacterium]